MLLPGQIPEAGVQMTCAPDMSDGNSDEFRAFSDDQIWEYGSRPGRVSERCGEKKNVSVLTLMFSAHYGSRRFSSRNQLAI